jgi:flagellar motility protein MotE (MotC chaperone)
MKKFASFVSVLCVLNLLAMAGLAGYLLATGRLDKAKGQTIVDLLRHPGTPEKLREDVADILEPPATAPAGAASRPAGAGVAAAGGAGGENGGRPATAEERIEFARQTMEQERLRLENEAQDLRHRQELLEQVQARVEAEKQKNTEDRKAFEAAATQSASTRNEEAFQKTLALYNELKPRQIKDFFLQMPPDLAARYLQAMPEEQAARIIGEFKAANEKAYISGVLDRIRSAGTASASGGRTQAN